MDAAAGEQVPQLVQEEESMVFALIKHQAPVERAGLRARRRRRTVPRRALRQGSRGPAVQGKSPSIWLETTVLGTWQGASKMRISITWIEICEPGGGDESSL
jgi:hypothetical protein